jgi:hypothetical protein
MSLTSQGALDSDVILYMLSPFDAECLNSIELNDCQPALSRLPPFTECGPHGVRLLIRAFQVVV